MSALSQRQQDVIDRFDRGMEEAQIALDLDMSGARVRAIISTFHDDPIHDQVRERSIRRGSKRLLWHIRKAGGHR
jgi:FixJ family two-component response regulator